ncbi:MAG: hypothetical protein M1813_007722 [Trichoglossum hirsutum]|nr:MAG: hypothetical protein M1813_007722 [Trichoglossum hirsutum]
MTPLSWAAKNGHEATVELLPAKDGFDRTPRMKIVGRYCRWQLKTGMRRPVVLDFKEEHSRTPLPWAAVVSLLLANDGVDPGSKDTVGQVPLSWAARNGHEAIVSLLLTKGVVSDSKDTDGQMPLSWAAGNGRAAVVELLLVREGVVPDSKDTRGRTPLLWAAEDGHQEVVEYLL